MRKQQKKTRQKQATHTIIIYYTTPKINEYMENKREKNSENQEKK